MSSLGLTPMRYCHVPQGYQSYAMVQRLLLWWICGMDKGLGLLGRFPGAEVIVVDEDMRVYVTRGLKNNFQIVEDIKCVKCVLV